MLEYKYFPCYGVVPFSIEEYNKLVALTSPTWEEHLPAVHRWKDNITKIAYINSDSDGLADPECPNIVIIWEVFQEMKNDDEWRFHKVELDNQIYILAFNTRAMNPEYPQADSALLLIEKKDIDYDDLDLLQSTVDLQIDLHEVTNSSISVNRFWFSYPD